MFAYTIGIIFPVPIKLVIDLLALKINKSRFIVQSVTNSLTSLQIYLAYSCISSVHLIRNRPFLSSPGPLCENEVKCSAFGVEMIFNSHANKTHFHKKGCALGLILKVRVFGT